MPRQLRDEIKQATPFERPEEEAFVSISRTSAVLGHALGEAFKPFGITATQYNVLRILRGAGDAGLPTLEIAERMIEETPGITRLIDRLETKGLVSRERCATDRRQVFCRISAAGLDLLAHLDAPIRQADTDALQSLGNQDLEQLIVLLDKTRNAFRRIH